MCDIGYFGGGEGGLCVDCDTAGDPTLTISLQLGGALLVLIVGSFLMIKYGKKALIKMGQSLQDKKEGIAPVEVPPPTTLVGKAILRAKQVVTLFRFVMKKVKDLGVKIKILISLYQVLTGVGVNFSIPYPDSYNDLVEEVDSININVPSLLPIDCLFGGISFLHVLLIQTAGPIFLIICLELAASTFRKIGGMGASSNDASIQIPRASMKSSTGSSADNSDGVGKTEENEENEVEGKGDLRSVAPMLAELCSDVSFFLIFLLYPGSSTKVFNALLCNTFSGEGEDGQSFLRVDFSIDCTSPMYVGFMRPYALAMVFVYPLGVPFFYWLTLFKNQVQLKKLQHLELSIANEKSRANLGRHMTGRALREYQPEIDEAEMRQETLNEELSAKLNLLPGKLKKLTAGYELRTYGFEIFECIRKMLLILCPIFFEAGSPEQLCIGLIVCFATYGAYMVSAAQARTICHACLPPSLLGHSWCAAPALTVRCRWRIVGQMYAPYVADDDDFLAQVCQAQIFFSLLSSMILSVNPNSPTMAVLLPIMMIVPAFIVGGLLLGCDKTMKKAVARVDNGVPTPCGRVGKGWRRRSTELLKRILKVKEPPVNEVDEEEEATTMTAFAATTGTAIYKSAADVPEHVRLIFAKHDVNRNGTFGYRELRSALGALGYSVSHPVAYDFIKNYDDEPDGRMELLEFANLVKNLEMGLVRSAFTLANAIATDSHDHFPQHAQDLPQPRHPRLGTQDQGAGEQNEFTSKSPLMGFLQGMLTPSAPSTPNGADQNDNGRKQTKHAVEGSHGLDA